MKTIKKIVVAAGISSLATLKLMSGPAVGITVQVPVPVPPPPPSITVTVRGFQMLTSGMVTNMWVSSGRNIFIWAGYGDYWLPCDSVRLTRFQVWERAHADWSAHTIVNVHYRVDARGHVHPWHGEKDSNKDDHGHNHGH